MPGTLGGTVTVPCRCWLGGGFGGLGVHSHPEALAGGWGVIITQRQWCWHWIKAPLMLCSPPGLEIPPVYIRTQRAAGGCRAHSPCWGGQFPTRCLVIATVGGSAGGPQVHPNCLLVESGWVPPHSGGAGIQSPGWPPEIPRGPPNLQAKPSPPNTASPPICTSSPHYWRCRSCTTPRECPRCYWAAPREWGLQSAPVRPRGAPLPPAAAPGEFQGGPPINK